MAVHSSVPATGRNPFLPFSPGQQKSPRFVPCGEQKGMGNASSVTLSDQQIQEIMANTDCNIPTPPRNAPKDSDISLHLHSRPTRPPKNVTAAPTPASRQADSLNLTRNPPILPICLQLIENRSNGCGSDSICSIYPTGATYRETILPTSRSLPAIHLRTEFSCAWVGGSRPITFQIPASPDPCTSPPVAPCLAPLPPPPPHRLASRKPRAGTTGCWRFRWGSDYA